VSAKTQNIAEPEAKPVYIRWMIRADLPAVLRIEEASFDDPWQEDDFIRLLRQRNRIGMVVDRDDEVAGYAVYGLHKTRLHLLNLAIHPGHRMAGVGRALIERIKSKLFWQRRIVLEVRETNLAAQFFFKRLGFRAVAVLHDFYEQPLKEDAYLMQYRVPKVTA